jgi:para-nitrobenzyl esterase
MGLGTDAGSLPGRDAGPSTRADSGRPDAAGGPDGGAADGGPSPRCPVDGAPEPGRVVTEAGAVQGVNLGAAGWVYRGIPYAAPPTGPRRWRPPEPPDCFDGLWPADSFSSECLQYGPDGQVAGDEDCLGLNLWTPVGEPDGTLRPVLFWIHGGGHEQGGGGRPIYDGRALARDHDVVVVTFNYRLGPLGFLSHPDLDLPEVPSGNYGMWDQLAALRWVHTHAERFGGDPERILIFGQSAGAVSTCRLVASPAAAGSFAAAVLQSGACNASPRHRASAIGRAYVRNAGCENTGDVRACLEALDGITLVEAFEPLSSGTNVVGSGNWNGVVDGVLVPEDPRTRIARGAHNQVPLIVGSTREENGRGAPAITDETEYEAALRALYGPVGLDDEDIRAILEAYPIEAHGSPRDAYVAVTSDVRFTCPASRDATLFSEAQDPPVYRYLFAHTADRGGPGLSALGAWHGIDLFFTFGSLQTASPLTSGPTDRAVTDAVQSAWTGLAADGTPGDLDWPAWDGNRLMLFDGGARVVEDPRSTQCAFWDTLLRQGG